MTTIKVQFATRDRIKVLSEEWHMSADQVVAAALDEIERLKLRHAAYEEARALEFDEADRAEAQAILKEMDEFRAW